MRERRASTLVEAARKQFTGASWQRCQVHLIRNMLGHCRSRERRELAVAARLIFASADVLEARRHCDERFSKTAPKPVAVLKRMLTGRLLVWLWQRL